MRFTDPIFSLVWDISDFFFDAFLTVEEWIWPFNLLQYPLYAIRQAFFQLLSPIANLGEWIDSVGSGAGGILDMWDILDFLAPWLDFATRAFNWTQNAALIISRQINEWWSSTGNQVQGWIDSAVAGFQSLISQVSASLGDLRTEWDNFWTLTWPALVLDLGSLRSSWESFVSTSLPGLATWSGTGDLIDSTIRTWFPFYDDLVTLWGDMLEFFTNPLDYLASLLERWFWER